MGPIASGGVQVLNPEIVRRLGIDERSIDLVAEREARELERRAHTYRGDRQSLVDLGWGPTIDYSIDLAFLTMRLRA